MACFVLRVDLISFSKWFLCFMGLNMLYNLHFILDLMKCRNKLYTECLWWQIWTLMWYSFWKMLCHVYCCLKLSAIRDWQAHYAIRKLEPAALFLTGNSFCPKNEIKNGKLKMKWFLGFFQLQEIRGKNKRYK